MATPRLLPVLAVALALIAGCLGDRPGTDRDTLLTSGKAVYSQHDEELKIRHFFEDMREGFYLDVGAWSWETNSTTAYIEHELGWSGIAIDASPGFAEGWAANRPRAKFFQYFVTDRSGDEMPFYLGWAVSSFDEEHVRRFARMQEDEHLRKVMVPTITLDDLLEREGVERIDLVSMDIEGAEPQALAGFDIERWKPRLVVIETAAPGSENRRAVDEYFERHGYRHIPAYEGPQDPNWYFTPADPETSQ